MNEVPLYQGPCQASAFSVWGEFGSGRLGGAPVHLRPKQESAPPPRWAVQNGRTPQTGAMTHAAKFALSVVDGSKVCVTTFVATTFVVRASEPLVAGLTDPESLGALSIPGRTDGHFERQPARPNPLAHRHDYTVGGPAFRHGNVNSLDTVWEKLLWVRPAHHQHRLHRGTSLMRKSPPA